MAEIEAEALPPHRAIGGADVDRQNVVSHGETSESDNEDMFSATDDEDASHHRSALRNPNYEDTDGESNAGRNSNDAGLLFYDENLDEEDEAYVYKHMRGGISENVTIGTTPSGNSAETNQDGVPSDSANETRGEQRRKQVVQMLKPRHSDAVLSCPCCFNIVCMDCQKHKRCANQYRAMFVMAVVVDWKHILVYDETHKGLVSKETTILEVEEENETREWDSEAYEEPYGMLKTKDGEYYAVECASCRTQVAALDMKDEVYHFHGCLESSSAF
mmetsp:Transcript_15518/g.32135  ORF Transcript_15518/g.32135 Transcript_15518/m.32135 type:complete len:274 (-) Transcript_15518:424-1245(-)